MKHYKQQEKKRRFTETKKVATDRANAKKPGVKKTGEATAADGDSVLRSQIKEDPDEFTFMTSDSPHARLDGENLQGEMRHLDKTLRDGLWPASTLLGDSFPHLNIDLNQNKAFIENLLSNQIEINRVERPEKTPPLQQPKPAKSKKPKAIPSSGRIMNYSDLPYMGEITLDGVKPRRGRKPKKADICHLIYKNYGQIFPGAPNSTPEGTATKERKWKPPGRPPSTQTQRTTKAAMPHPQAESPLPTVTGLLNHSEVQNRIINSLLERRLTQKVRGKPNSISKQNATSEEPLNLCLKDLQSLKIKLSRKHGNIYETKSPASPLKEEAQDFVEVKKEVIDLESEESSIEDSDLTPFNLVTAELRDSDEEDSISLGGLGNQLTMTKVPEVSMESQQLPPDPTMFWPGGNYFYPPMPLMPDTYYQKISAIKSPPAEKRAPKTTKTKSQNKRLTQKPNPNAAQVIARRKRSAIFIPPVPAENTSNPTTEVSICKFKFTGGAKPSLQEKKMLSVDSGGNFRYYSGTGDKSMRGYEYFPRESLQQCQENTGCSPSGVFLTASALGSGEKIPEDVGHSGFFDPSFPLQVAPTKPEPSRRGGKRQAGAAFPVLREHLTDSMDGGEDDSDSENSTGVASPLGLDLPDSNRDEDMETGRRSRRSRKSLAREKLEQTFKEKGFLIQTQQLESAEGATYCKFRQLRKFTRYLFRSWKDYLPGNVRDLSESAGVTPPSPSSPPLNSLGVSEI